ncbi:MAG: PLP-dependent cysteine synthase family protein, partial [Halobacteriaceae archaeon]
MDESILETIGSPLVRVESPEGVHIAAKIESFNPGGSAKDRPALYMIRRAEKSGDLSPGGEVIEATSGNTGIGLAMVCAVRGYDLTIVMPKSKSKERRQIMKAYGATIELIEGDMQTANQHAKNIAEKRDAVLISQFENPANPQSHYETTAEEILEQIGEREIDAFVAGVGTGGTLTGVASRLLEEFPDLDIYAVEPEQNA